jgi:hypothetical protein
MCSKSERKSLAQKEKLKLLKVSKKIADRTLIKTKVTPFKRLIK